MTSQLRIPYRLEEPIRTERLTLRLMTDADVDDVFAYQSLEEVTRYELFDPRNDPSIALCRRLGMREEAHFVKDFWFTGEWGDTGIYAMLREEWLEKSR